MSTMIPNLVVGEVGFGNNFAPESEFYRDKCRQHELEIKDLEAEVAELEHDVAQRHDAQRPAAVLHHVADEPQAGAADGIRPGIEVVEGDHGRQNKEAALRAATGR